jgi:Rho-type GTPase-activating protein 1/2
MILPSSPYRHDREVRNVGHYDEISDDFIPMALDPNLAQGPSPMLESKTYQPNGKSSGSARPEPETLGTDYFNIKEKSSKRKVPREVRTEEPATHLESSKPESPHVIVQKDSIESENFDSTRRRKASTSGPTAQEASPQITRNQSEQEKFKLQEAPKRRKSSSRYSGSGLISREQSPALPSDTMGNTKSAPVTVHGPLREQSLNVVQTESSRNSQLETPTQQSPRTSQDSRFNENFTSGYEIPSLPKRGDSLQKSTPVTSTIPRKDVPTSRSASHDVPFDTSSPLPSSNVNGGRIIGRPMESPVSKSLLDVSSSAEQSEDTQTNGDSFVSPRAPPPRPAGDTLRHKAKNASISTIKSESLKSGDQPGSPSVGRFPDDDTIRNGEDSGPGFFTRTFSKSNRHARSHSDRVSRHSREHKWPRTPLNGDTSVISKDLSSPTMSSPESKGDPAHTQQEIARLRQENQTERQRVLELETKLAEFEQALGERATITKVESELREKRSTMVILDTQKELVVRELEIITEHLEAAKKDNRKFDLNAMQPTILREFAESLEKLKNSYTPQIEERIQLRNDLQEELDDLDQKKEKAFREFESLSLKNAQLAEFNNTLVSQIQELQNKVNSHESKPSHNNILGIYTHPKDKSNASIAESQLTGSTLGLDQPPDSATFVKEPTIVTIRKTGVKKPSGWGRTTNIAKNMKKAFTSTVEVRNVPNGSAGGLTEGFSYGGMSQSGELPVTTLPAPRPFDENRSGRFLNNKKQPKTLQKPGMAGISGVREAYSVVPQSVDPSSKFVNYELNNY